MVTNSPRMTFPTRLVLGVVLDEPDRGRYGAEIGSLAGLPSGTVHPILARLEGLDWLTSEWEDVDPVTGGGPARRYYRLTGLGAASARSALVNADRAEIAFRPVRPVTQS